MKGTTPLVITLYDPETNEEKATFSRAFVPYKLLKAAIRLSKAIKPEDLNEDDADALASLVVEVFGNKFSVEDLNECSDITEMVTVLNMIMAKARGLMPNPTPPGK